MAHGTPYVAIPLAPNPDSVTPGGAALTAHHGEVLETLLHRFGPQALARAHYLVAALIECNQSSRVARQTLPRYPLSPADVRAHRAARR